MKKNIHITANLYKRNNSSGPLEKLECDFQECKLRKLELKMVKMINVTFILNCGLLYMLFNTIVLVLISLDQL